MTPEQLRAGNRNFFLLANAPAVIFVVSIWGDRFILNEIETLTGLRLQPGGSKVYVFLLVLAIQFALLVVALIYIQRYFLPRCPSCLKSLGQMDQGIAIATKHCPHCGAQIITVTSA
jgi:predicted RNA-binding Zn-ribbon protein involved in translation (DUF1610 family)